jgi:hypothetical protein
MAAIAVDFYVLTHFELYLDVVAKQSLACLLSSSTCISSDAPYELLLFRQPSATTSQPTKRDRCYLCCFLVARVLVS